MIIIPQKIEKSLKNFKKAVRRFQSPFCLFIHLISAGKYTSLRQTCLVYIILDKYEEIISNNSAGVGGLLNFTADISHSSL